ncbi:acyl-CoA dehydrogenase [Streptomyces sp. NA04227]|uniref:acyl-CoA dehydrogenase n=1 Tax=Streptomyces sp. NA04227 TaxID=2742136 RepID=UPI00158FE210|nr:acyl-CoA dehydrogenase [Streptomyces sp. NA04227]QKW05090.1 acyl-CoA dehydrogenase [Streptomyces sp. NA04227]
MVNGAPATLPVREADPVHEAAPVHEADPAERAARLESLLGDPTAAHNPAGYRALLTADRKATPPPHAEDLLVEFGLHEEFVPRALGGRFDSVEGLLRLLRTVWRRDIALGIGYGTASFAAASDVWLAGSEAQRRHLAALLLDGGRAAHAPRATAHPNSLVGGGVDAAHGPGGLRLTGTKPMVLNLPRAKALVLSCRTDERRDSRGHSQLLLAPEDLSPNRYRIERRAPALGLRGAPFGAMNFDDCPVPEGSLLGPLGSGVPNALRSAQVDRTLTAALALAAVDTGLRTAVLVSRTGTVRRADAAPVDPRHTAKVLTSAFVDLLLYDCLAVVATRALHLRPAEASVYAAALKSLLPKVLVETMYELSTVLGSEVYTRQGTVGIFQKHLRDLPMVSLGHTGTAACHATLLPQLPLLARHSWLRESEAPAAMFRPHDPLPPFSYAPLAPASGRDSLSACLVETAEALPSGGPVERALATLARQLLAEFKDLRTRASALPPPDGAAPVSPAWFALSDRYVLVLAAAAVLGIRRHNRDARDPFLADPSWAAAALHRIARRLGISVADLPAECTAPVHKEVLARFRDRRSYDLYRTPVAG